MTARGRAWAVLLLALLVLGGFWGAEAQPAPTASALRLVLLPQWVIQQHQVGSQLTPSFQEALNGGVVDRTVFAWQRGVVQRSVLVAKPIRILPEPEATALGARGRFELGTVRPPVDRTAWTEVELRRLAPAADDVLILEVGGERNTVGQVLETLLVAPAGGGRLEEIPLVVPALIPSEGVPILKAPVGVPLDATAGARFRDVDGLGVLVVRSPVATLRGGDLTPNGLADTARVAGGDWRDGDRVLLRLPGARLGRPLPGLILSWKDRTLQNDPDGDFPRRSSLPLPLVR